MLVSSVGGVERHRAAVEQWWGRRGAKVASPMPLTEVFGSAGAYKQRGNEG